MNKEGCVSCICATTDFLIFFMRSRRWTLKYGDQNIYDWAGMKNILLSLKRKVVIMRGKFRFLF